MILPFWPFWPLNFKRPQLVDVIKLDQVWWQDNGLHWIFHPKSILNFWGCHIFGGQPPKYLIILQVRLERGPHYSARRRNFQKRPLTFVVLRWGYTPSTFHHVSSQHLRCPTQKTKKVSFLPVLAPFSTKWLGHCGFQRETWQNQLTLQYYRRTENIRWLFWKFCLRAEK